MNDCEFCNKSFKAHPQVRNPRACSEATCQAARQRSNEKDWHSRHANLYDRRYHRHKKIARLRRLKALVDELLSCLEKGALLLGLALKVDATAGQLRLIFSALGVRRLNKLWKP